MVIRSSFYGLEIAKTGLFISQKGLDVTGHNIANVDTAGYTRQRLSLQSIDPNNASYKMKPLNKGLIGGGVQIQMVEQIRNQFLDRQYRTQQSKYSYWATRTTGLGYLESLYDSKNESGISTAIINLFNAFDDLVHTSSDEEQRTITQEAATTFVSVMNSTYESMVTQLEVQNESVKGVADQINNIIDSIAILNESIYRFEDRTDGMQQANDLRDKRNLLLDELSALIDIEYKEGTDGKLTVTTLGGDVTLVSHTEMNKITCTQITNPYTGKADYWQLTIQGPQAEDANGDPVVDANGDPVYTVIELTMDNVRYGELKGHLELRDSMDKDSPGIPYFMEQLNTLIRALVVEINAIHREGFTHSNSDLGSVNGINFFWEPSDLYHVTGVDADGNDIWEIDPDVLQQITVANFRLSDEVAADNWNIACSDEYIDLTATGDSKAGNQNIAEKLAALIDSTRLANYDATGVSSFNGYILSMVAEYTSTAKHSKTQTNTLSSDVLSIDNNRLSVSGVSLDEEMTNLIKYQHAYNGASRVITAMDEALDKLINGTGLVGRS